MTEMSFSESITNHLPHVFSQFFLTNLVNCDIIRCISCVDLVLQIKRSHFSFFRKTGIASESPVEIYSGDFLQ